MVYVNNKKFACESCIKGHRSSSCHHTDRPLFEIKKKGRPVSQCTKCRELRQSKKFHSKCTCNHQTEEVPPMQPLAPSSSSKTRRFIPIVPALPNGLRDVMEGSSTITVPADARQRVDSLLNPCECKSVWGQCRCRETNSKSKASGSINASAATPSASGRRSPSPSTDALSTLANAAVAVAVSSCCAPPPPSLSPLPTSSSPIAVAHSPSPSRLSPVEKDKPIRARRRPGSPHLASTKRHKSIKAHHHHAAPVPGPALAPLLYLSTSTSPLSNSQTPSSPSPIHAKYPPIPDFSTMTIPPMSEITSLAGTGCTCGIKCACPGCVEHRGPDQANHEHRNCADGCGTCIDESMGIELPGVNSSYSSSSSSSSSGPQDQPSGSSFLDRFFARAAALPAPPANRRMDFDPMDTTVWSPTSAWQTDGALGPVNLPKLECCGGQCLCPAGQCSCRTSCAGCCDPGKGRQQSQEPRTSRSPVPIPPPTPVQQETPSCCCG